MVRTLAFSSPAWVSLLLALNACSAGGGEERGGQGGASSNGSNGSNGSGDNGALTSTGTGGVPIITLEPEEVPNPCEQEGAPDECELVAPPACGDGEINLDPPEACDDGNGKPGDGCSGGCIVEPFWECPTPGAPCVSTIICGDGTIGPGEACDDGNTTPGDGCAADCKSVEVGYRCRLEGMPCERVFLCGDGILDPNEGCDDGGIEPGDGCDQKCRMEIGYKCEGSPSTCSPTTCGDGVTEGAESCDDGNDIPFDGCTDRCQAEPQCAGGGACTSTCGDGIVLDEDCDDGNLRAGDGCSSTCTVEDGFNCVADGLGSCEQLNGECILRVPGLFRDFTVDYVNTDFPGSTCSLMTGLVGDTLDAQGKPTYAGSGQCIKSATTFAQWYTDNEYNRTMPGSITLFNNGQGGFVNRLGPNGEQFIAPSSQPISDQPCTTDDCLPCQHVMNQTCDKLLLDGNPMFFPLDDFADAWPDARTEAQVPQQVYLADGWPPESEWPYWPDGYTPTGAHNFNFTSEVQYWFRYDASASATLEFIGDDDMWVFINGHLAVDLGGVHTPEAGSVTIDATTGPQFELQDGEVYPIKMFHAERKDPGSSFKLTLSGFTTGRSDCSTNCGDGEVAVGEECDDGPLNMGGYNQCTPDCTLGPRCGDGIPQEEFEACDYGEGKNTGEYGGCAANCQLGPHCGDGITTDAEECDDGVNDGGYGECAQGCVLGPVCGDGGWQPEFEECDDGNNVDKDGCSAACKIELAVPK